MRDRDPVLENVLDRLVPPVTDEAPDWDEVLRRAEVADDRPPAPVIVLPRRRRTWYALAAAAFLTVLVVNPAFGIGPRIIEWFEGTPAPQRVRDDISLINEDDAGFDALPEHLAPQVLEDQARGVMAIETSAGPVYLWAAPTVQGGWCTHVMYGPPDAEDYSALTSCPGPRSPAPPLDAMVDKHGEGDDTVNLIIGRVGRDVATVELVFDDGGRVPLVFRRGFFIAELPRGEESATLVARDSGGAELARQVVEPWEPEDPEAGAKPLESPYRKLIDIPTRSGGSATLSVAEIERMDCYSVMFDNSDVGTCAEPGRSISYSFGMVGIEHPSLFLDGFVAEGVERLELRFDDGRRADIPLVERFFLYEVPAEHTAPGRLPSMLVAFDARGAEIGARAVDFTPDMAP